MSKFARGAFDRVSHGPGRVLAPWPVLHVGGSYRRDVLAPLRMWARRRGNDMKNYRARSQVEAQFRDFSSKHFINEVAIDTFRAFHAAYAAGDVNMLRDLCTDGFTQSVKKGIAHSQHEFGGVCGMQVLNFLSAPELLNMRLVYGDSLNGGGLTTQPTHVQLSARLATRQLPVFERPAAQHGHSGQAAAAPGKKGAPQVSMKVKKLRGGKAKRTNSAAAAAAAAAASAGHSAASTEALPAAGMVGHWLSAVDHASGREYYYNDTTGKSTWAIPPTLGTLSHIAWEPETGTQALEPLPDDTTADGQQLYRAESVVTWERAFGTGKGGWRIAGIM